MGGLTRRAAPRTCAGCGRVQVLLLPEAACGSEFVWTVRCGGCGAWRWFHSREDGDFVRAILETAKRRGEPGGLSEEGRREAHAEFESGLPSCPCGGRFHVVRSLDEEACTGCGRELRDAAAGPATSTAVEPLRR